MARQFGLSRPTGPQVEHNVIQIPVSRSQPRDWPTTEDSTPPDFIWSADFKRRPLLHQTVIDLVTVFAWLALGILFAFGVGSVVFIMGFLIFFG